jgi:hypothetical protein
VKWSRKHPETLPPGRHCGLPANASSYSEATGLRDSDFNKNFTLRLKKIRG